MSKFTDWFDRFLDEKNVPCALWEITDDTGTTNFIDSEVVIEHIKIAPALEQSKIKDILVKIDFHNGDVNHFFRHLATALVNR